MQETQSSDNEVSISPITLPKGGGAIQGLGETLGEIGPSGAASFSLPLPVSAGRGYAPDLTLSYGSDAGNDVFGLGWELPLLVIRRRTNRGVPQYGDQDEFLGPDGEVMVAERDAYGALVPPHQVSQYGDKNLGKTYDVSRYLPRVENAFALIEHWNNQADLNDSFWLVHDADGQLHCLGKTTLGRTSSSSEEGNPRIAEWWLEESVSPTGEHIRYRYKAEDDADIEDARATGVLSYPARVDYGNKEPATHLYAWDDTEPTAWLFSLVLDYGGHGLDPAVPPPFDAAGDWPARQDPFSGYEYGYETRCYRLCRQALMYHNFPELSDTPTLVSRLLLNYDENPVVSRLTGARLWVYGIDDEVESMPPLELRYSAFNPIPTMDGWQSWEGLPGLNDGQPFQLVDLYGEGLAGVLHQQNNGWHYREPLRDSDVHHVDAVTYSDWQPVPQVPSMQPRQSILADINSDGRLDWLVTQPGLAGYFSLNPDKSWSNFTPFNALPAEFFHPEAQLADLIGAGLSDLALIGPKSVRLYANQRDGFAPGQDVPQADAVSLPVIGRDERSLVAFSDLLGSGQQHLVQISYDQVQCWPNLGHGRFGTPVVLTLTGLDGDDFNPRHLYLLDIDGSGASDLVYAHNDRLSIYLNQSGNGFADPVELPLPTGVRFDGLCQINVADLLGNGTTSLLLTLPHMQTRHWRYDFSPQKPYLLNGVNNHMGADSRLTYRSSAQFWLDEKDTDDNAIASLPFPIHLLSRVISLDEITGNKLTQVYRFHKGVYDGVEREFRGFAYVESEDTGQDSSATGEEIAFSPPVLTKTWYHTGREDDETELFAAPWAGDANAHVLSATRLTQWVPDTNADIDFSGSAADRWWLFRALKGRVLRQEVYGLDASTHQATPYSISTSRYQVRLHQVGTDGTSPVALPMMLEQLSYGYERIVSDPQCSQQVALEQDVYGHPLHSVAILYPRRTPAAGDYPDTLPTTALESSRDQQQQILRLTESKQAYYHLEDEDNWQLGLPHQQRQNVLTQSNYMGDLLSFESLTGEDGLLENGEMTETFAGQEVVFYQNADGDEITQPTALPTLVHHIETAELDDRTLQAYDDARIDTDLNDKLKAVGYQLADRVLGDDTDHQVWVAAHSYAAYKSDLFYLTETQQNTKLTGALTYTYNDYAFLQSTTDVLGNRTRIETFNYRFLTPEKILDINNNISEAAFDAFGRVMATSMQGTEYSNAAGGIVHTGFTALADAGVTPLTVAELIHAGLSADKLPVAIRTAYDAFSWMGQLAADEVAAIHWQDLIDDGFVLSMDDSRGYITAAGHRWAASDMNFADYDAEDSRLLRNAIASVVRTPPHSAAVQADRYPDDEAQQKAIAVSYNDGFGRALQVAARDEPGPAWQREDNGELAIDGEGHLIEEETDTRWAVSGKVEYNNKGQTVRVYQPYFVNDWQYVVDHALRANGYADTHFYDALGRESQVETAKGYIRRVTYYPWFVVNEDENDTWSPT